MGLEEFEPIFGEATAESATSNGLNSFLFYVYAVHSSLLKFVVSDFRSSSWEAVRSLPQLEDLQDCVGVGGPWSEFMDYVISSLKSKDVKIVLEGQSKLNGATSAKLVAQKSKGMPLISISLLKLVDTAAGEAIANLSFALFKAFRDLHGSFSKEQERCSQLTRMIAAEQEKSQSIKSERDALLYSKKQKLHHNEVASSLTAAPNSSEKQPVAEVQSTRATNRVVPAFRRAKVRGAVLQDTEEGGAK